MQTITTDRLRLDLITMDDHPFMMQLVNTEGWLKYVGDRNVHSAADAQRYVERLMNIRDLAYRMIRLKENNVRVGIISFMKLNDPPHYDLGFALLPEYYGKGYAYEAAQFVKDSADNIILATVVPDNVSSIRLLERLRFTLKEEIYEDGTRLLVYKCEAGFTK